MQGRESCHGQSLQRTSPRCQNWVLIQFGFESLNAGVILSTHLLKGPALAVRSSAKSTVLLSNFTVTEFMEKFYRFFKAEETVTTSGLRYLTTQPSCVLLRYHGLHMGQPAVPPWTGSREN